MIRLPGPDSTMAFSCLLRALNIDSVVSSTVHYYRSTDFGHTLDEFTLGRRSEELKFLKFVENRSPRGDVFRNMKITGLFIIHVLTEFTCITRAKEHACRLISDQYDTGMCFKNLICSYFLAEHSSKLTRVQALLI